MQGRAKHALFAVSPLPYRSRRQIRATTMDNAAATMRQVNGTIHEATDQVIATGDPAIEGQVRIKASALAESTRNLNRLQQI